MIETKTRRGARQVGPGWYPLHAVEHLLCPQLSSFSGRMETPQHLLQLQMSE